MASDSLQLGVIIGQINTNNYRLSSISQQRIDINKEITDVIEKYGQDSPQYEAALAQTSAMDESLELEQNELQITNEELNAWKEQLEDHKGKSIDKIFGK